jgi:hypothetical protein
MTPPISPRHRLGYRVLKSVIDQKSELLEQTIIERDKMFRFTALN